MSEYQWREIPKLVRKMAISLRDVNPHLFKKHMRRTRKERTLIFQRPCVDRGRSMRRFRKFKAAKMRAVVLRNFKMSFK